MSRFWFVFWLCVAWSLFWIAVTDDVWSRTLQEMGNDEWKCTNAGCERGFDRWVLVETAPAFHSVKTYKMRTEFGCLLAQHLAGKEQGEQAACYEQTSEPTSRGHD